MTAYLARCLATYPRGRDRYDARHGTRRYVRYAGPLGGARTLRPLFPLPPSFRVGGGA